ncbi:SDR family oxidoreductase [Peribacillus butanolivorans]|jgi:NAD(P)-dependent dehydrogenase (short-subunit alcohol dehydrogenase family)|uniref:Gluconate 5-dehydrogenase n=1 Tax=Peribacillus butanolivorans TaxID=421767 RepID=A0AAX0S733_9BACI|nr:SDR family oxidoreductase [Peribacillus butanolivorans]AXN40317.1 SDR family NAD(P)-dependent oxidoreductase [Peribacillus butanolivorans]MCO0600313.1 SDR family oxidoreductase [Peribacillus butanolivorans]PEJ35292.1 gluconate 5-dehydrogenase [Peribacillus butanolivorans]QNU05795.1 SDR family oxidoreductase [Peribacillus butanolivorans]
MKATDLFDLTGKTAIITGGGRGLGEQIATGFAEAGANVVLCSRKKEACDEVASHIEKLGVRALSIKCDITNPVDVQEVVNVAYRAFGSIDILVNNSGASWGAPAVDMPLEAWQKVMNVNVTGTFIMSQTVGRIMIEQGYGKIINIASVAGLGGTDPRVLDTVGYNTSKGAVITLTKDLAVKWGQHNINVNAIAPGFFPTKMTKGVLEKGKNPILESTPLKRLGSDDDLKGAAIFLASKASDYVTGNILIVDGGSHAM